MSLKSPKDNVQMPESCLRTKNIKLPGKGPHTYDTCMIMLMNTDLKHEQLAVFISSRGRGEMNYNIFNKHILQLMMM